MTEHQLHVEAAAKQGKIGEGIKDYPDLQAKYGSEPGSGAGGVSVGDSVRISATPSTAHLSSIAGKIVKVVDVHTNSRTGKPNMWGVQTADGQDFVVDDPVDMTPISTKEVIPSGEEVQGQKEEVKPAPAKTQVGKMRPAKNPPDWPSREQYQTREKAKGMDARAAGQYHENLVAAAAGAGEPVPDKVLARYPNIKQHPQYKAARNDLERSEAARHAPLSIGDTFTYKGKEYQLESASPTGVSASETSGTVRMGLVWNNPDDFEAKTGIRIAPQANEVVEGKAIAVGDTFTHDGREHRLTEATANTIRATDLSANPPIGRVWHGDDFTKQTGYKVKTVHTIPVEEHAKPDAAVDKQANGGIIQTEEVSANAEPRPIRTHGEGSVEGESPVDVRPTGEVGPTGTGVAPSAGGNAPGTGQPARPGVSTTGSGGSGAAGIHPPAEREGHAQPGRTGEPGEPPANVGDDRPEQHSVVPHVGNYRITPLDHVGEGTPGEMHRALVRAIKTLKQVEAQGSPATPEQQAILVKFPGWGWTGNLLNPNKADTSGYKAIVDQLTPEELTAARGATLNSHYTSPVVIEGIWNALRDMGFDDGKVLEPGAGIGLFIGLAPDDVLKGTHFHAIELDDLTGRILKQLCQNAAVDIAGFENVRIPDNSLDLAISNVPFGNYPISDKAIGSKVGTWATARIHNYFFVKALEKVRPGGLLGFISSNGTLDAGDLVGTQLRRYLSDNADFLGAIRLPNTAFAANAHTEVVTDIIFLQKRAPGVTVPEQAFTNLGTIKAGDTEFKINQYFIDNPDMVLGKHSDTGKMYKANAYTVEPDGRDMAEALRTAMLHLPPNIYTRPSHTDFEKPAAEIHIAKARRMGSIGVADDGRFYVNTADGPVLMELPKTEQDRVSDFVVLRDHLLGHIEAMKGEMTDAEVKSGQTALKKLYDAYVKKHGPLHEGKRNHVWKGDSDASTVLALERWKRGKLNGLSDIFAKRTIVPVPAPAANTSEDALTVSLREHGKADPRFMSDLLERDGDQIVAELESKGLLFKDPHGGFVAADEYGSGNVKTKLAEARQYQETAEIAKDSIEADRWSRNVAFLESVQPPDVRAGDISIKIGSRWVPAEHYKDFAQHLYSSSNCTPSIDVFFNEANGKWEVEVPRHANSTFGTARVSAGRLLEHAMRSSVPTVKDSGTSGTPPVVNTEQTALARQRIEEIKAEWEKWVHSDIERLTNLTKIYNDTMNVLVSRKYDGAFLELPGSNPTWGWRAHQKNAIWRTIQSNRSMLAHEAGLGKTAIMIGSAMEMRRMGLRNKPVHILESSTVSQYAEAFKNLYAGSKILVGPNGMTPPQRKEFLSAIVTGDWDSVLMGHETAGMIPLREETVQAHFDKVIGDLREYLHAQKAAGGQRDGTVKEIERTLKAVEVRLQKKLDALRQYPDAIYWEDLGIDHVFVDESQAYKNLGFMSSRQGFGGAGSDTAFDLDMKLDHVARNGGGITFSTGTPITNTIAEMYTLMHYLAPDMLEQMGLQHFDAWAQTFADTTDVLERSPTGAWVTKSRLSKFGNVPELGKMFQAFADVLFAEDVSELERPVLTNEKGEPTGKPITVTSKITPEQLHYFEGIKQRWEDMLPQSQRGPEDDNPLTLSNDGRFASCDLRLRIEGAKDSPGSKINQVVANVARIYADPRYAKDKRTQLVFLDLGTPSKTRTRGIDLYADIKKKLVAKGIPAAEIAFIHDSTNDEQRLALFDDLNDGVVRVLIGSRAKLGIGVNVQERLIAGHQVDPPWRPDQLEQADKRLIRHGNQFQADGVQLYYYVAVDSFDNFTWDKLKTKKGFIDQLLKPNGEVREIEDITADQVYSYAQMAAVSSGNPKVQELVKISDKLRAMDLAHRAYLSEQSDAQWHLQQLTTSSIPAARAALERARALAEYVAAHAPAEDAKIVIDGKEYDKKEQAGDAIKKIGLSMERWEKPREVGEYSGFKLSVERETAQIGSAMTMQDAFVPCARVRLALSHPGKGLTLEPTYVDATADERLWTKITNRITKLTSDPRAQEGLESFLAQIPGLEATVAQTWPHEEEYNALLAQKTALEREVGASAGTDMRNATWGSQTVFEPDEVSGSSSAGGMAAIIDLTKEQEQTGPPASEPGEEPPPQSPVPTASQTASAIQQAVNLIKWPWEAGKKTFSAGNVSEESKTAAQIIREATGENTRAGDIAWAASEERIAAWEKASHDEVREFYRYFESGRVPDNPEWAHLQRDYERRGDADYRIIKSIKDWTPYLEHHFPHLWKDPDKARSVFAALAQKRPLEGRKGFLKHRTLPTIEDGLAAGLELADWNPERTVVARELEIRKFAMAHDILDQFKENDLAQYVPVGGPVPEGYATGEDNIFVVYGNPEIPIKEAFDALLTKKLDNLIADLGVENVRKTKIGGKRWGYSEGDRRIMTKFAGPEAAKTHELGHILNTRYGLYDYIIKSKIYEEGKRAGQPRPDPLIQAEMRNLADLRYEGVPPEAVPDSFKKYVRKGDEKMANLVHAYVHARETMAEVAPDSLKRFEQFISEHPELAPLRDIKPSLVVGQAAGTVNAGGMVIRGHWYLPEDAARVINNYLSPGLWGKDWYRVVRQVANGLNQVQLGLSLFHAGFTTADVIISHAGAGWIDFLDGKPISAARRWAGAPLSPGKNLATGVRMRMAWSHPGTQPADIEEAANYLAKAGGRSTTDPFYYAIDQGGRTNHGKAFMKALKEHDAIQVGINLPQAIIEGVAYPTMRWLVPSQKAGMFKMLLEQEFARNPDATEDERIRIAQGVCDNVDNRLGQLTYDNLFWNKTLKDTMMLAVRAVGWKTGTIGELGGAVQDTLSLPGRVRSRGWKWKGSVTQKQGYALGLFFTVAITGAIITKIMTGDDPEGMDYFAPRIGGVEDDGTPRRIQLPTYMKDVLSFSKRPTDYVKSSLHPGLTELLEQWNNNDWKGDYVALPDDPFWKQVVERGNHFVDQYVPYTVGNITRKDVPKGVKISSLFGVTKAPRYIENSKALNLLNSYQGRYQKPTSTADLQIEQAKMDLRDRIRSGEQFTVEQIGAFRKQGLFKRWSQFRSSAVKPYDDRYRGQFNALSESKNAAIRAVAGPDDTWVPGTVKMRGASRK